MWRTSRMKMVYFQPGWDSLNWCQDVKSKISFFSEIPKYLTKENTWRFYLYWGLLLYKSRANLIFRVLPEYIRFLWAFALEIQVSWSVSWSVFGPIECVLIGMFIGHQNTCTWPNWCKLTGPSVHEWLMSLRASIQKLLVIVGAKVWWITQKSGTSVGAHKSRKFVAVF